MVDYSDLMLVLDTQKKDHHLQYTSEIRGQSYLDSPSICQKRVSIIKVGLSFPSSSRSTHYLVDTVIYRRSKDVGTPVGDWTYELTREDAWFRNVVPDVPTASLFE